jgi:hypothetical protein
VRPAEAAAPRARPARPGQAVRPAAPPAPSQPTEAATPAVAPVAPGYEYVDFTGFKNQIFELKHRNPGTLLPVLQALGSGFRGATMQPSSEFKTITVRDWPENIAAIGDAIKRLDVPEAPKADIELHLHVLIASTAPGGGSADIPAEVKNVVNALQSTLNYKSFTLLTPIIQRTREGFDWTTGRGTAGTPNGPYEYAYQIRSMSRDVDATGAQRIELNGFQFSLSGRGQANVSSNLSLKPGEQVVVGTASIRDGALVLVLSVSSVK